MEAQAATAAQGLQGERAATRGSPHINSELWLEPAHQVSWHSISLVDVNPVIGCSNCTFTVGYVYLHGGVLTWSASFSAQFWDERNFLHTLIRAESSDFASINHQLNLAKDWQRKQKTLIRDEQTDAMLLITAEVSKQSCFNSDPFPISAFTPAQTVPTLRQRDVPEQRPLAWWLQPDSMVGCKNHN